MWYFAAFTILVAMGALGYTQNCSANLTVLLCAWEGISKSVVAATPIAIILVEIGAWAVWKFPSERLWEKIEEGRARARREGLQQGRQEGRQEAIQELRKKGIDVPDDMISDDPKQDQPPSQ